MSVWEQDFPESMIASPAPKRLRLTGAAKVPAATIEATVPKAAEVPIVRDEPPSQATRLLAMRGDARAIRASLRQASVDFAAMTRAHACELQRAAGAIAAAARAVELRTERDLARARLRLADAVERDVRETHERELTARLAEKDRACEELASQLRAAHADEVAKFARGVAAGEEQADAAAVRELRNSWSAGKVDVAKRIESSFAEGRGERVLLAALRDEMRDECQASIEEYRREVAERFGEAVKDAVKDALVERRVAWDEEALKRHEESLALCQRQHDLERVDLLSENRRLVARVLALER